MEHRPAATQPLADPALPGPIAGDQFAQGLLLVRASALSVARLHLASDDEDRRRVLETMDELVAIDRKIGSFVADIPTLSPGIGSMQTRVEAMSRALARDKLSLAAGISRRGTEDRGPVIGRGDNSPEPAAGDYPPAQGIEDGAPRGRVALGLAKACAALVVMAFIAAAVLLATGDWQAMLRSAERLVGP